MIQAALDGAQNLIEAETRRRFDSRTATLTRRVINGQLFLPDLISATTMEWAASRFSTFASVDLDLDDEDPHRRAWLQNLNGVVRITGTWGFSTPPDAIKGLEIDLAAGSLVDGPRATGRIAAVDEDASISLQVTPEDVIEAYRDRVQYI